jgi:hypothetical protein
MLDPPKQVVAVGIRDTGSGVADQIAAMILFLHISKNSLIGLSILADMTGFGPSPR